MLVSILVEGTKWTLGPLLIELSFLVAICSDIFVDLGLVVTDAYHVYVLPRIPLLKFTCRATKGLQEILTINW